MNMRPKILELTNRKWISRLEGPILELFIFNAIKKTPRYGRELVELAREQISPQIKRPTVYSILKRRKAFFDEIDYKYNDHVTRGEKRKYYVLNDLGVEYLNLMISSMQNINEFLFSLDKMKIYP
jgi:DNA-binding PadR family transcriptional regulator